MTPIFKKFRRWRERRDRCGDHRSNAGHAHQPRRIFMILSAAADFFFDRSDFRRQSAQACDERFQSLHCSIGKIGVFAFQPSDRALDMHGAFGRNNAEFSAMAAQRVDQLRALTNKKITCAKRQCIALLVRRFRSNEAHVGADCGLADCFGAGRVILLAFDEGLHIGGRNQFRGMPQPGDLARPEKGRRSTPP